MVGVPEIQCELENLVVCPLEHRCGCRESCLRDEDMMARSSLRKTPLERTNAHADEVRGLSNARVVLSAGQGLDRLSDRRGEIPGWCGRYRVRNVARHLRRGNGRKTRGEQRMRYDDHGLGLPERDGSFSDLNGNSWPDTHVPKDLLCANESSNFGVVHQLAFRQKLADRRAMSAWDICSTWNSSTLMKSLPSAARCVTGRATSPPCSERSEYGQ